MRKALQSAALLSIALVLAFGLAVLAWVMW